jgi:hypothetical protein
VEAEDQVYLKVDGRFIALGWTLILASEVVPVVRTVFAFS